MIKPIVQILNDDSPMPFGKKYRGIPMRKVPVGYLHWINEEVHFGNLDLQAVRSYIFMNIEALRKEDPDRIWSIDE